MSDRSHTQNQPAFAPPPDAEERSRALDPEQSFLVQAPAGSGKTHLLTQRFLRLLALAEKPDEIVAITFTNAAAAEMRQRILGELEKADAMLSQPDGQVEQVHENTESLSALAASAMRRAKAAGWQILDQPHQLRITTIDAFCRELALKSPLRWGLLSSLGGRLEPVNQPENLYRQAARRTLQILESTDSASRPSVEALLRWRDNNWSDIESLIVAMLKVRTRWHQEFVFARDADWDGLRARLEAPFQRYAKQELEQLRRLLDGLEGAREFALELIQFACRNRGKSAPMALAECAELPNLLFELDHEIEVLEDAVDIYREFANFLLTKEGEWRKRVTVDHGFPPTPEGKAQKARFAELVESLAMEPGLDAALASLQQTLPLRYSEEEWALVRHCFAVLREAYGQLQLVFSETGSVDFTEVARIALEVLSDEDGLPSDLAIREADSIRHLLIDEFQDTSRNQHELLARLIGAWPDREGRTLFCVGDPMQSIYSFRDAEVELFERVKTLGIEPVTFDLDTTALLLESVALRANFRTTPSIVEDLNTHFGRIFAKNDGSGVSFSRAEAARAAHPTAPARITEAHLAFTRKGPSATGADDDFSPESTRPTQLAEMVDLIRSRLAEASEAGEPRFRIAVLGRKRASLVPVAEALREAAIRFRAIELVKLNQRPEVLDALTLAQAILNPANRTAWLGVLRAPWCGLSLAELHLVTSADNPAIASTPVPVLLQTRLEELAATSQLPPRAFAAAARVRDVLTQAAATRGEAGGFTLGTWLESVWKALGGEDTATPEERENLRVLWTALDTLAEGEVDLLGSNLASALDRLHALPDPAANSEFGVQLMTIHKSKGLEFEMVIVPDLEAPSNKTEHSMMSWLERGVSGGNEPTEFLIAPIQTKGGDASPAKKWVQSVRRKRETQELRRVLYVAATRAREELHLFIRPRFKEKVEAAGPTRTLANPDGLLATAWPALGEKIESIFTATVAANIASSPDLPAQDMALAASAETGTLLQMPTPESAPIRPTRLRRLPADYVAPAVPMLGQSKSSQSGSDFDPEEPLYARTEGGLHSRLIGKAVHILMERLSHLYRKQTPAEADIALAGLLPAIEAEMRREGLPQQQAKRLAAEALSVARAGARHPDGAWILAPHTQAISEGNWTGLIDDSPRNLHPDRVFIAATGAAPGERITEATWWIVDYKTSHASYPVLTGSNVDAESRAAFLEQHRGQHQQQLAIYADLLRGLDIYSSTATPLKIRTGLYYPRLGLFDWWQA
jgi:ATP-dependent helicase/nuclease subunit A